MTDLPALDPAFVDHPTLQRLTPPDLAHPPRFLLLYGSLRERSRSAGFLIEEADRLLRGMGAETRIFDPRGLPQVDDASRWTTPRWRSCFEASLWSEGPGVVQPGAARRDYQHLQVADRLAAAGAKAASGRPKAAPWRSAR